jgi:hypothetical protein
LIFTLIAALSIGWWFDHHRLSAQRDECEMKMLEAEIRNATLSNSVKELREICAEAKKKGFVMPLPPDTIFLGHHEY